MKYYANFDNGKMTIQELSEKAYDGQPEFQKQRGTYDGVPIFDTLSAAIKSLDGYSNSVSLPNGTTIIPSKENYHMLLHAYVGNVWVEIL